MITKEDKKNLKEMNKAYYSLKEKLSCIHCGNYGNQLYKLELTEAKEHNRLKPDDIIRNLSISEETKLFFVLHIIEGLEKPCYTVKDVLYIKPSVILAQSIAENYKEELIEALKGIDIDKIKALDYAELMKTE